MLEKIFLQILNMSLMARFIIPVVILLRLPLKKAPKNVSYALWGIVLFRLICPFSFESAISLLPSARPLPQEILTSAHPIINSGIPVFDNAILLPAPAIGDSVNPMQALVFIGAVIWLVGVVALFSYSVISYFLLKNKVKFALLLEDNIYESDAIASPFVLGIFNPKIYLPNHLQGKEKAYILEHEHTHIKRFDTLIKPLAFLALSLHWFNPLCWLSFILMSRDMELSCDEIVLKKMGSDIKQDYSSSLLSLACPQKLLNGSPLAFGESNVNSRIKNILNYKKPTLWVMVLSIIVVVIMGVSLLTNPTKNLDIPKNIGVNAVILEINYETTTITVKGLDENSVLGDRCIVYCSDAAIMRVVNSNLVDLNFEKLSVGDNITVDVVTVNESYPTSTSTDRIQLVHSMPPDGFNPLEWAQNLKENDIERIELIVQPSEEDKRYKKYSIEEFADVVKVINQSKGKILRYNETLSGSAQTLYLTTKDGNQHTISNGGNEYLIIDGQFYSDNSDLLALWNFQGNSSVPDTFYSAVTPEESTSTTASTKVSDDNIVFTDNSGNRLTLDITLPNDWSMKASTGSFLGYVAPTVDIYNGTTLVGEIFCSSFEIYRDDNGDIPYMSVYHDIMMSSVASWGGEYTEINKTKNTATALCKPWHRIDIPGVSGAAQANVENRGILSYNAELQKYIGIHLNSLSVTDKQWKEIAETIKLS